MKLKKKKLNKDKSLFKQRRRLSTRSLSLFFGTHGIFISRCCRFEMIYFVMLRKILKRHRHYVRDKALYHKKIWFWLRKNYVISRKSKNARMGKGKGKFNRYAVVIPKNFILLEFAGWHLYYLKNISKCFTKRITIHISVYTKQLSKNRATCENSNYSFEIIKKYTLI